MNRYNLAGEMKDLALGRLMQDTESIRTIILNEANKGCFSVILHMELTSFELYALKKLGFTIKVKCKNTLIKWN